MSDIVIEPPFATFRGPIYVWDGEKYIKPEHDTFIAGEQGFQCLDCGKHAETLNVLNAMDCEEDD